MIIESQLSTSHPHPCLVTARLHCHTQTTFTFEFKARRLVANCSFDPRAPATPCFISTPRELTNALDVIGSVRDKTSLVFNNLTTAESKQVRFNFESTCTATASCLLAIWNTRMSGQITLLQFSAAIGAFTHIDIFRCNLNTDLGGAWNPVWFNDNQPVGTATLAIVETKNYCRDSYFGQSDAYALRMNTAFSGGIELFASEFHGDGIWARWKSGDIGYLHVFKNRIEQGDSDGDGLVGVNSRQACNWCDETACDYVGGGSVEGIAKVSCGSSITRCIMLSSYKKASYSQKTDSRTPGSCIILPDIQNAIDDSPLSDAFPAIPFNSVSYTIAQVSNGGTYEGAISALQCKNRRTQLTATRWLMRIPYGSCFNLFGSVGECGGAPPTTAAVSSPYNKNYHISQRWGVAACPLPPATDTFSQSFLFTQTSEYTRPLSGSDSESIRDPSKTRSISETHNLPTTLTISSTASRETFSNSASTPISVTASHNATASSEAENATTSDRVTDSQSNQVSNSRTGWSGSFSPHHVTNSQSLPTETATFTHSGRLPTFTISPLQHPTSSEPSLSFSANRSATPPQSIGSLSPRMSLTTSVSAESGMSATVSTKDTTETTTTTDTTTDDTTILSSSSTATSSNDDDDHPLAPSSSSSFSHITSVDTSDSTPQSPPTTTIPAAPVPSTDAPPQLTSTVLQPPTSSVIPPENDCPPIRVDAIENTTTANLTVYTDDFEVAVVDGEEVAVFSTVICSDDRSQSRQPQWFPTPHRNGISATDVAAMPAWPSVDFNLTMKRWVPTKQRQSNSQNATLGNSTSTHMASGQNLYDVVAAYEEETVLIATSTTVTFKWFSPECLNMSFSLSPSIIFTIEEEGRRANRQKDEGNSSSTTPPSMTSAVVLAGGEAHFGFCPLDHPATDAALAAQFASKPLVLLSVLAAAQRPYTAAEQEAFLNAAATDSKDYKSKAFVGIGFALMDAQSIAVMAQSRCAPRAVPGDRAHQPNHLLGG